MKFAPFIYDYLTTDDWDFLEEIDDDVKEYFGFDVPFTKGEIDEKWDEIQLFLEDWIIEHGLKEVASQVVYTDLEKCYQEIEVVFSFDGKYYRFVYIYSLFLSTFADGYPKESEEVFPVTKTITVYDRNR